MLTKRRLLSIFKSQAEVARALGISRKAVSRWPLDSAIPKLRELELTAMYPQLLGEPYSAVTKRIENPRLKAA